MLTSLRNTVLANYGNIFASEEDDNPLLPSTSNLNNVQYERVKDVVLRLANKYSNSMTKEVAENLSKHHLDIKKRLNNQLCLMLDDLLKEIA